MEDEVSRWEDEREVYSAESATAPFWTEQWRQSNRALGGVRSVEAIVRGSRAVRACRAPGDRVAMHAAWRVQACPADALTVRARAGRHELRLIRSDRLTVVGGRALGALMLEVVPPGRSGLLRTFMYRSPQRRGELERAAWQ